MQRTTNKKEEWSNNSWFSEPRARWYEPEREEEAGSAAEKKGKYSVSEEYTSKLHSNSRVREIALDPTKPALKRRRSTTTTLGVSSTDTKIDSDHDRPVTHSDIAAAFSPEDQSILRDATEEEQSQNN